MLFSAKFPKSFSSNGRQNPFQNKDEIHQNVIFDKKVEYGFLYEIFSFDNSVGSHDLEVIEVRFC